MSLGPTHHAHDRPPPTKPSKAADLRHVRPGDMQAAAQLAAQATHGVINITEGVHQAVRRGLLADRLTGDGLVPLRSALGQHDDPARQLAFAPDHQQIAWRTGHLDLLGSRPVAERLQAWLTADRSRA